MHNFACCTILILFAGDSKKSLHILEIKTMLIVSINHDKNLRIYLIKWYSFILTRIILRRFWAVLVGKGCAKNSIRWKKALV